MASFLLKIIIGLWFSMSSLGLADSYRLQYSGRLVQTNGRPVLGPINLEVDFYNSLGSSTSLASQSFNGVTLTEGVFQVQIDLADADFQTVFSSAEVWIEVTDVTNGKIYPRQQFTAVPFAFQTPTDDTTVAYDTNGKLQVIGLSGGALPAGSPSDGQVLKWNAGVWEWSNDLTGGSAGSVDSATIADDSITNSDIAASAAIATTKLSGALTDVSGHGLGSLATSNAVSGGAGGTITDGTIVNDDVSATAAIATSKLSGAVTAIPSHGLGDLATESAVSGGTGGTITDDSITDADINASAAIADSKLATISTAGKVSNSATTATSSNSGNTIVARDGSGNFTAGTITATLSGNATTATTAGNVSGTVAIANGGTGATNQTDARSNLGLGSIATQASDNVTISGGSISGVSFSSQGISDNASSTAVTINASGNVGIGTSPSSNTLEVSGTASATSFSSSGQAGLTLAPFGTGSGQSGEIRFQELSTNGSHAVGFKAPDSVPNDQIWTLPNTEGESGQVLSTNGGGSLSWGFKGAEVVSSFPTCDGTNLGHLVFNTSNGKLAICINSQWKAIGVTADATNTFSNLWLDSTSYTFCLTSSVNGLICTFWGDGKEGTSAYLSGYMPFYFALTSNDSSFLTATQVSFASGHACGRYSDGTVRCAGGGAGGKLGDGTLSNARNGAVLVSGLSDVTDISAGYSHTCAVKSDGTVWCWGSDGNGELGNDASLVQANTPVQVAGISTATMVDANYALSCARLSNGEVSCWGSNFYGAVGNNTTNTVSPYEQATPVTVSGVTTATKVSVGNGFACALLSNGTVTCWGYNGSGELGDGSFTNSPIPVAVSGLTNVTDIKSGSSHTCAKTATNELWCWGGNWDGQLGDFSTTDRNVPVKVPLSDVGEFALGAENSCAIVPAGVYCWGDDEGLGIGNFDYNGYPAPAPITGAGAL